MSPSSPTRIITSAVSRLLTVVIFCALAAAPAAAGAPDALRAAVDHAFRPLIADYHVPGIAVAGDGRRSPAVLQLRSRLHPDSCSRDT